MDPLTVFTTYKDTLDRWLSEADGWKSFPVVSGKYDLLDKLPEASGTPFELNSRRRLAVILVLVLIELPVRLLVQ
jgi:hypothetical protein